MINEMIKILESKYQLKEQNAGEFASMKVSGMKFTIHSYEAEGLGHVSTMQASGFFGLMKMDTLIINPTEIDMPLLSYDRVLAMGNDTLIYELYDTLTGTPSLQNLQNAKETGKALPDNDPGTHWYDNIKLPVSLSKKGKKKNRQDFDTLAKNYFEAFLKDSVSAGTCDPGAKKEKASVYVEGLLKNGGPSTDVFKKAIGNEKTALLFRTVLFGTKAN